MFTFYLTLYFLGNIGINTNLPAVFDNQLPTRNSRSAAQSAVSVTKRGKNSSFHFKPKVQATFLAECTCIRVNSSSDRDDAILENDYFLLPSQSRSQGSLYSSVWEGSSQFPQKTGPSPEFKIKRTLSTNPFIVEMCDTRIQRLRTQPHFNPIHAGGKPPHRPPLAKKLNNFKTNKANYDHQNWRLSLKII